MPTLAASFGGSVRFRNVPAPPIDRIDPAEPIERMEPDEPMDRIDPAEPIETNDAADSAEPTDSTDPADTAEATEPIDRHERSDHREPHRRNGSECFTPPDTTGPRGVPHGAGGTLRPAMSAAPTGDLRVPPPVMTPEELDTFLAGAFPKAPRTYRVAEVTDTGVVLFLAVGAEHERPGGTVSGPTMMGLADAAAWLATLSRIGPVALSVTSSLTINFLRKPPIAGLWARATLLRLGRRQSVSDVGLLSDGSGDLVAQATVTYAIPAEIHPL